MRIFCVCYFNKKKNKKKKKCCQICIGGIKKCKCSAFAKTFIPAKFNSAQTMNILDIYTYFN